MEESGENTGGGGSGIFGAIASVVGSISNVIVGKQQKDISYNQWLSSNPTYYKWFYQSDDEKDNSGLIIIGVLAFLFIFIIGIITYIKMKRNV